MRSFSLLALIPFLASSLVSAIPTPTITARSGQSLNPDAPANDVYNLPAKRDVSLSNAERFARGLPPRSPSRIVARNPGPSQVPTHKTTGVIKAKNSNGELVGYIYQTTNSFGEYGITTDKNLALGIDVNLPAGSTGGNPIDLTATNGNLAGSLPLIGAIEGFSNTSPNLAPGSYNYLYLGGVSQTSPNATPAAVANSFTAATNIPKTAESAIWGVDLTTGAIVPQWINTDSSKPAISITYVANAPNAIVLTGDLTSFTSTFGPNVPITLTFESA